MPSMSDSEIPDVRQSSEINLQTILQLLAKESQGKNHVLVQKELNACVLSIPKILSFHENQQVSVFDSEIQSLEKRVAKLKQKTAKSTAVNEKFQAKNSYATALKINLTAVSSSVSQIQNSSLSQPKNHREKRLILKTNAETTAAIAEKAFVLRNKINDVFSHEKLAEKPVLSSICKSFRGNSIVFMTTDYFSADFLQQHRQIWQSALSDLVNFDSNIKAHKDEHWGAFVVHGIFTEIFNIENGLSLLKEEIETFNSIQLKRTPVWLSSAENREFKKHASALFHVENTQTAESLKTVSVAGQILRVTQYNKQERFKAIVQCLNCQIWGHTALNCKKQARCGVCAQKHQTELHKCLICETIGKKCIHSSVKCANCHENHESKSTECIFYKKSHAHTSKKVSSQQSVPENSQKSVSNSNKRAHETDSEDELNSSTYFSNKRIEVRIPVNKSC